MTSNPYTRRTGYPPAGHKDACDGSGKPPKIVRKTGRKVAGYWNPGRGQCSVCKLDVRLDKDDKLIASHWKLSVLSLSTQVANKRMAGWLYERGNC